MHTKSVEYKGFTIEVVSYDGLGTVRFTFFVKGNGFKKEGYATLNHAKGAITKALKASAAKPVAQAIRVLLSRNKREGRFLKERRI